MKCNISHSDDKDSNVSFRSRDKLTVTRQHNKYLKYLPMAQCNPQDPRSVTDLVMHSIWGVMPECL